MSNQVYILSASDLDGLKRQLSEALMNIENRLSKLEGVRGNPAMSGNVTVTGQVRVNDTDGNYINGFGDLS